MRRITPFIIVACTLLFARHSFAAFECAEPPLTCGVSYSTVTDEYTGNFPLWVDCSRDGELMWTSDGEVAHIPSEETLEEICLSSLETFKDEIGWTGDTEDGESLTDSPATDVDDPTEGTDGPTEGNDERTEGTDGPTEGNDERTEDTDAPEENIVDSVECANEKGTCTVAFYPDPDEPRT